MNAVTVLPASGEAIITGAQEILYRAADAGLPAGDGEVTGAMAELAGALRRYRSIRSGAVAPAQAYWQLEERPGWQAVPEALFLAAQDAGDAARELADVIRQNHGDEMAALVSGQGKGE